MRLVSLIILVLFCGCTKKQNQSAQAQGQAPFVFTKDNGAVSKQLEEASGLVASFANPAHFWTVNDSGNPAEVFLIDSTAQTKIVCKLGNIANRDWEDIAIGVGPVPGKKYLYVADIGDNLAVFPYKYIYRFEEPSLKNGATQTITDVKTFVVLLPDGKRDTETLMIDPITNDLYIVSKREEHVNVYLQKFPYASDTLKPEKVLTLPYNKIVAGSISQDGQEVLMKNYDQIFYWKRSGEKSVVELLKKPPIEIPYEREPQGEAMCWSNDTSGFYTLSESNNGVLAQLKYYKRK